VHKPRSALFHPCEGSGEPAGSHGLAGEIDIDAVFAILPVMRQHANST